MILQALSDLARQEDLVGDPDYEWRPIAWRVRIDRMGKLLGIESTHYVPESPATSQRVPKPVPTSYLVPREQGRTSGDYAFFLFDKAEYVFGVDPTGQRQAGKLDARSLLFRQRVEECAQATSDEGVLAVSQFLKDVAAGRQHVELPEDCAPNDLFAFVYAPDVDTLVTSRENVRSYWKNARSGIGAGEAKLYVCLVSGTPCVPVEKHPPIKRVPGGTTTASRWFPSTVVHLSRTAGIATRTPLFPARPPRRAPRR
jgi:CRISPR-associated protein Csd1